jgi:deoxyribodipyrimidine photolyase-related protein
MVLMAELRNLVLVLGDQLDRNSAAFDDFDPRRDAVWMAENHEEATHVRCHKLRLAFFFSAMRHFREACRERGQTVHYHALTRRRSDDRGNGFADILKQDVQRLHPQRLVIVEPGDDRVLQSLKQAADRLDKPLDIRTDRSFYCSTAAFLDFAEERKGLLLENFYRTLRKRHGVLLTGNGQPAGGAWNFDKQNRATFGRDGPPQLEQKDPRRFGNDAIDAEVLKMVEQRFADHPGSLDHFDIPRTHAQARALLRDFITHRLGLFGTYEDAMWSGETFLWHSRLSAALNVKLLDPRACVDTAIDACNKGHAPINSVEGFVRQILGWREFMRVVYWTYMPGYIDMNALNCEDRDVPRLYWTGETDMNCLHHAMQSVLRHGYAHHIQRLMVFGLFALLTGVHPRRFHDWHMAMYLDAIDWVSLPNALGMSQYGDGGLVATKPYAASGNYINKMSNYCQGCRYRPNQALGEAACPFTTLYYDFLARHHRWFENNPRMALQLRNLDRKSDPDKRAIRRRARSLRDAMDAGERV